ncbi:Uncharacterised protein [Vibrio cholerae]|uniref:Uncharacterized protein n=1 Tax=Vibrio cholerae TaxID=666 RepID=A0A655NVU3_VIBCL|nr:Uncharacterised protein [Vibrio cholerae]CRZ82314.1 Uncharacterised protein [Vibrio cholerae]CRZ98193.1 Uncharacterised protein [Vibrio cholerae]CSB01371.1 Uncharacterised protein [Vibrio cholerae]CSB19078.1 Uncharacterised protein [Vibrio cholerae]
MSNALAIQCNKIETRAKKQVTLLGMTSFQCGLVVPHRLLLATLSMWQQEVIWTRHNLKRKIAAHLRSEI